MTVGLRALCGVLACASLLALAAGAGAAEDPPPEVASVRIAVAPFQLVAPPGADLPDFASALADQVGALGVGRLVRPESLGSPLVEDPSASVVRSVAREAQVDAVVVGRTTRLGNRLSVDVRLRSGRSGVTAGTFVSEVPSTEDPTPMLERLARELVNGTLTLASAEPLPPGSAAIAGAVVPGTAPGGAPAPEGGAVPRDPAVPATEEVAGAPFGLADFPGDAPISIRAEELEATERGGERVLHFRRGVNVAQGDLSLRADRLEASYAAGSKQPRKLVAEGGVRLREGDREARCDHVVYDRAADEIVCRGNVWLRDGGDHVEGDRAIFEVGARRVVVEGAAALHLAGRPKDDADPEPGDDGTFGELELDASLPVDVRAERLEAVDDGRVREIRFAGGVEVVQSDVVLRSDAMDVQYAVGDRQPDRIAARGNVQIVQGTREARCDEAVFRQGERHVDCAGNAMMRDGGDVVRGDRIALDLEAETVQVRGHTRLTIAPRPEPEAVSQ